MVKIRLRRTGAKKQPHYRVVVADSRTPRDGRFIEIVGHYNPRTEPSTVKIHEDRVLYWLSVGAQPTASVKKLLENLGTLERFARFKQGAELDELLAEAEATREANGNGAQAQTKAETKQAEAEPAQVEEAAAEEPSEASPDSEDMPEEPEESEEASSEDDNN